MSLTIAVPKEQLAHEERVALDPATVERLRERHGVDVQVQSGCGRGAGFYDVDYGDIPILGSFTDTIAKADIPLMVKPPSPADAAQLPWGSTLITQIPAFQNDAAIRVLLKRNITTIAMNLVPRITRAQPMDVLSSQATVAGYKAALLAAELSPRMFPMLSTAAGTVRPSRVIVIGAGVAGLQAIATARRLGAQVEAYDIRTAAREQIESLGARMIDTGVIAEGVSGYARGLTREEKQQQHDVLAERLSHAHAVICAAAIPGRNAPTIVTTDMVEGMLPDTVLVDMAAESGGNCELTRPGETYVHGDTLIVGPSNLPSTGAVHASELYSRNLYNMLKLLIVDGALQLDWEDEVVASCILTYAGGLYHEPSAAIMNLDVVERQTGASMPPADVPLEPSASGFDESSVVDEETNDDTVSGASIDAEPASESVPENVEKLPEEPQKSDDFQVIDGVGPVLDSRLKEFGVLTFEDLAALDETQAERLEMQLEIEELGTVNTWVEQARRKLS